MTRILFITATRIGDAIMNMGVLDHLIASHPDARITVGCGPLAAPLFRAIPEVERVIDGSISSKRTEPVSVYGMGAIQSKLRSIAAP